MKQKVWFGLGTLATFVLIAAMLLTGWLWWRRRIWAMPMGGQTGMFGAGPWSRTTSQASSGVMDTLVTLQEAQSSFERYLENSRYEGLEIAEVMEFEHNFYAIAVDSQTGIGAMELLADKNLGAVSQEMGPNMMWNAKGMMGRTPATATNRLTEAEALQVAKTWVVVNQLNLQADEHADPFSGYYTIHTLKDGRIDGMLSVHGESGQVWYHSWHGDYVGMLDLGQDGTDH